MRKGERGDELRVMKDQKRDKDKRKCIMRRKRGQGYGIRKRKEEEMYEDDGDMGRRETVQRGRGGCKK